MITRRYGKYKKEGDPLKGGSFYFEKKEIFGTEKQMQNVAESAFLFSFIS